MAMVRSFHVAKNWHRVASPPSDSYSCGKAIPGKCPRQWHFARLLPNTQRLSHLKCTSLNGQIGIGRYVRYRRDQWERQGPELEQTVPEEIECEFGCGE